MSNLLNSLGIDPDSFSWRELAVCQGDGTGSIDPDNFFDNYEDDVVTALATDQMCLHCPVAYECLLDGTESNSYGVWGGVYLTNGRVDYTKNTHKTTRIWRSLEEIHDRKFNKIHTSNEKGSA